MIKSRDFSYIHVKEIYIILSKALYTRNFLTNICEKKKKKITIVLR